MLPSQRRPEPGLLRRGPKADEAPLADDDRAPAAAEQTQQSIEMHPALIGGDPDSEIEQHGIQRPLPRLRAPRPVHVDLAKLGIAGSAARLRINDPAGEQRDRLHREHQGKKEVLVYDYKDSAVPVLARMAARRGTGYRAPGYVITTS
jgi:hypothetical protein